jgi:hypothetical protein
LNPALEPTIHFMSPTINQESAPTAESASLFGYAPSRPEAEQP